jgi:hypothetical protein
MGKTSGGGLTMRSFHPSGQRALELRAASTDAQERSTTLVAARAAQDEWHSPRHTRRRENV